MQRIKDFFYWLAIAILAPIYDPRRPGDRR